MGFPYCRRSRRCMPFCQNCKSLIFIMCLCTHSELHLLHRVLFLFQKLVHNWISMHINLGDIFCITQTEHLYGKRDHAMLYWMGFLNHLVITSQFWTGTDVSFEWPLKYNSNKDTDVIKVHPTFICYGTNRFAN